MNEYDVKYLLDNREDFHNLISSANESELRDKLLVVFNNIDKLMNDYKVNFFNVFGSSVRYSDYYNPKWNAFENVSYFINNYKGNDLEKQTEYYQLYRVLKELFPLIKINCEESFSINDLLELYDIGTYYDDLIFYTNNLVKVKENEKMILEEQQKNTMKFLHDENPYKIFFAGYSYDDIRHLPTYVSLQLVNKLYSPLATETVIPLAEGVDHVRKLYDFPLQRIQVADDYRIVFVRHSNVTIILGVGLKTGKNIDYTRYDSVAKVGDTIYKDAEDFVNGITIDDYHNRTVELLDKLYKKHRNR